METDIKKPRVIKLFEKFNQPLTWKWQSHLGRGVGGDSKFKAGRVTLSGSHINTLACLAGDKTTQPGNNCWLAKRKALFS